MKIDEQTYFVLTLDVEEFKTLILALETSEVTTDIDKVLIKNMTEYMRRFI